MSARSISDLEGKECRLKIPLRAEDIRNLELGDLVYLDGEIFTGRALFYIHVLEKGNEPPVDIAKRCNVHMHGAPAGVEEAPGRYRISSMQATASFRYYKWVGEFLRRYGVKAVIGKGGMSEEVYETAFKPNGAVFLTTVGYGIAAIYGRGVKSVNAVHWKDDLGLPEAMWIIRVENFGPFIVECDVRGRGLSAMGSRELAEQISRAYDGLPELQLKRFGEVSSPDREVI